MGLKFLSVVGVLLLSQALVAQSQSDGIQAFLDSYVAAFNSHDVEALMRLHAEDTITVNRLGELLVGRDATRTHMETLHRTVFRNAHFPEMQL